MLYKGQWSSMSRFRGQGRRREEKRRVMNDASLQIGQPIRANHSPSSVSCIEMRTAAYPGYETVHIFVQIISPVKKHPRLTLPTYRLPSTARHPLLVDILEKMTIPEMVQTSDPLLPGTFESSPPEELRCDFRRSDDVDCDVGATLEPSFPGRIVVRWMDGWK